MFSLKLIILTAIFINCLWCGPLTNKNVVRSPSQTMVLKVRIKDMGKFIGFRNNPLVGYGLVVGLNGTGDTISNSPYTKESLIGMLERLGVNIRGNDLPSGKNVAAVMVTSTLPPFAKSGSTIDVIVSALGDAKSLQGGNLLVTPLLGADSEVYAVAQGEVVVSGTTAAGVAASQTTGIPTTGKITNGAIVEKQIPFKVTDLKQLEFVLNNPDLTTAGRIASEINNTLNNKCAAVNDAGSVKIDLPTPNILENIIKRLTIIEQLEVVPDQAAKVIIDPAGVIVMGERVRISPIALTQGSITVGIAESAAVYQPNPSSGVNGNGSMMVNNFNGNNNEQSLIGKLLNGQSNQATIIPETDLSVTEVNGRFAIVDGGVSLQEVVDGLNMLGVSPREMAQILQTIKAAGALHAEVIIY